MEHYIAAKQYKGMTLTGRRVIPKGAKLSLNGAGRLVYQGKAICTRSSQVAYDFLVGNDDGCGEERFRLTQAIQKRLRRKDEKHQDRWDKVWESETANQYKDRMHEDFWIWDMAFYNAPVEDLRKIYKEVAI